MVQGEKKLVVVHCSKGVPKEVFFFMSNCRDYYLGYFLEIRRIQKNDQLLPSPNKLMCNPLARYPAVCTISLHYL